MPLPGRLVLLALLLTLAASLPARSEPPAAKVPVLLDTDIGGDIDDAFALALALSSPELEVRGITTVAGDAHTRASLVCRLLHAVGRGAIPVASSRPARSQPDFRGQLQYGLRPAFRKSPERDPAVEFLYKQLKTRPGELTLLAIGPLTNIAELLTKHPDCQPWIKRIVIIGGAIRVGYENKPPVVAEWNVKSDIKAAQTVFRSGVPLLVAPLDATTNLKLPEPMLRRVFASGTPLTNQLCALYQLWDKSTPTLFDPVAVALCFEERFCTIKDFCLNVDDLGITRVAEGKPNARVAMSIQREEFLKWFVERVSAEPQRGRQTAKPMNVSPLVARGGMPHRIHVIEDYETDIERRWWLCGKLETKNVPPDSRRACRGVLTNDFDDLMGDPKAMYTAVIYNPVPGPPMGKNTRLCFRYWLKGTDKLRVQIYSLSKGYHRHLTLTGLSQGAWQSATVDMTAARRPDGSGGPLSEGERIDDIQFYTDPSAELIIDDIVLYDAAPPGEKRPFPKRPIYTAWFDTGRQGKEWPGKFEIVALKPPLTGKAAKSIQGRLALGLRERPLGKNPHLQFRYYLTGAESVTLWMFAYNKDSTLQISILRLKHLKQGQWAELNLDLAKLDRERGGDFFAKPRRADEFVFELEDDAELLVDDVLLYEPGDSEKR